MLSRRTKFRGDPTKPSQFPGAAVAGHSAVSPVRV
jgi:hypothetical protein